MEPFNAAALDPCIREVVVMLRSKGFETTDSGDGISKPDEGRVFDFPHVAVSVKRSDFFREAHRLQAALGKPWRVEASYSTEDRQCVLFASRPLEFNPNTMLAEGLCS